ncbi:MAG: NADH:flavin oxidoreductase [Planctomycetota bacterium]|nr:NADH:flavin oxidoreductase [Planctomycetota bacterium]
MKIVSPNRYRDVDAFRARWKEIAVDLDLDDEIEVPGPLGSSIEKSGWELSNRFAVHPMEGWDALADGQPSGETLRRWRRFGESGAALIWGGEAFAVGEDGRANPNQLFHRDLDTTCRSLESLRSALEEGRASIGDEAPARSVIGLQLTHSGRWSRPTMAGPSPRIAFEHPVLDGRVGASSEHLLSDTDLQQIAERYVEVARCARDTGFDFVDLKACHGYLIHELLAARTREGPFGGDLEGRSRFLRDLIGQVRSAVPDLGIGVRLSVTDVVPFHTSDQGVGEPDWPAGEAYSHGFGIDPQDPLQPQWDEPLQLISLLQESGINWLNLTIGSPYWCPHRQRPAQYPPSDGYPPPEDPLVGVAQHLKAVRRVRSAFPDLGLVGTGWSYLQEWLPAVAQHEIRNGHQDVIGLGRSMLSYPELPRDVIHGRAMPKKLICRTFSDCTTAPRNGLLSGCFPLDEHYKKHPAAEQLKGAKSSARKKSSERKSG